MPNGETPLNLEKAMKQNPVSRTGNGRGTPHQVRGCMWVSSTGLASLLLLLIIPANGFTQQRRGKPPRPGPTTQTTVGTPGSSAASENFDQLSVAASAAREGDRVDEAIDLYRKAVALRPLWAEGWWYLATLYYDKDNYAEAATAFKRTAQLQQKAGAPWAMLGLCEFQLGHYDDAYNHIEQGRHLGLGDNVELTRVMRYHEGLIAILKGDFEKGQQTLGALGYEGLKSEDLIIALGLAVLRIGMTPKEVYLTYPDRNLIRRAGLAEYFAAEKNMSDAQREYDLLARDFSTVANVQYAYGRFLLTNRDDEGALAAFLKELENWPKHTLARCQIANIKLRNRDIEGGLPFAEQAVKEAPRLPLAHYLLGRLLLEAGQNKRAIEELEASSRMVPDESKVYFALARAYSKAGRKQDADRARETFTRLSRAAQTEGQIGGQASAIPEDGTAEKEPQR
jgi:predicted Zn-dependent protease